MTLRGCEFNIYCVILRSLARAIRCEFPQLWSKTVLNAAETIFVVRRGRCQRPDRGCGSYAQKQINTCILKKKQNQLLLASYSGQLRLRHERLNLVGPPQLYYFVAVVVFVSVRFCSALLCAVLFNWMFAAVAENIQFGIFNGWAYKCRWRFSLCLSIVAVAVVASRIFCAFFRFQQTALIFHICVSMHSFSLSLSLWVWLSCSCFLFLMLTPAMALA